MRLGFSRAEGGAELYVDLGTANTLVVSRGRGLVINEPSVVAFRELPGGRRQVIAVGNEAKEKIGRTPGQIVACHPLRDGVIADSDITESMLRYFITRSAKAFRFMKPRMVISMPYGVTDIEKKAVRQAGMRAGAREVYLIDEPMAAAIGAGLAVHEPMGNMIIDIGGGTTEVAVISLYGIVHCEAVRVGGHSFDNSIVEFMAKRHNLVIGDQSAERVKISIGSALPGDVRRTAQVRGIDSVTGLPRSVDVSAAEINESIEDLLQQIIEAARRTLEVVPPDLIPDILKDGAVIAGGGALIHGLRERLQQDLKIPIRVDEDPLRAIAKGGERIISSAELLQQIAMD